MKQALFVALPVAALFLIACGSTTNDADSGPTEDAASNDAAPDATGTGTAVLSFTLDQVVRDNPPPNELNGTILGTIFAISEIAFVNGQVTDIPDNATEFANIQVENADFRKVDLLPQTWTGELPPGEYTFLGAIDIDDNGNDLNDPVTGVQQRSFVITAGATTEFTVNFNLLQPF